jgi:hypothetical protein
VLLRRAWVNTDSAESGGVPAEALRETRVGAGCGVGGRGLSGGRRRRKAVICFARVIE